MRKAAYPPPGSYGINLVGVEEWGSTKLSEKLNRHSVGFVLIAVSVLAFDFVA